MLTVEIRNNVVFGAQLKGVRFILFRGRLALISLTATINICYYVKV